MNLTERTHLDRWIDALILAVHDEGPMPRFHRQVMQRHRREWPTLWDAIDGIIRNQTNQNDTQDVPTMATILQELRERAVQAEDAYSIPDEWVNQMQLLVADVLRLTGGES